MGLVDWDGMSPTSPENPNFNDIRDVTTEINEPLHIVTAKAEELRAAHLLTDLQSSRNPLNHGTQIYFTTKAGVQYGSNLWWFYKEVTHGGSWDIKVPEMWDKTIGTEPPGSDTPIVFRGQIMTRESLGNWTYGYIGAALGLPSEMLLAGSWGADAIYKNGKTVRISPSFPWQGEKWENERGDWDHILDGFNAYIEDMTGDVCN